MARVVRSGMSFSNTDSILSAIALTWAVGFLCLQFRGDERESAGRRRLTTPVPVHARVGRPEPASQDARREPGREGAVFDTDGGLPGRKRPR